MKLCEKNINQEFLNINFNPDAPGNTDFNNYEHYFNYIHNIKNLLCNNISNLRTQGEELEYWGEIFWNVSCIGNARTKINITKPKQKWNMAFRKINLMNSFKKHVEIETTRKKAKEAMQSFNGELYPDNIYNLNEDN